MSQPLSGIAKISPYSSTCETVASARSQFFANPSSEGTGFDHRHTNRTIASAWTSLSRRLAALPAARGRLAAEIRAQRDALVHPGFLAATPWGHLTEIPRYLTALDRRLAKHDERPDRDAKHGALVADWRRRYEERLAADRKAGRDDPRLDDFRWLLEELKVSLFAQELRTPFPVSQKRVEKAWAALAAG